MSEAEEMELFKKEFYEDLSKITNHRTVSNAAVNISEEAFKAMKDDPQYREKVLDNDNGTAPGLILEENGKRMILLPGPPNELHPLFEQQVKPYLQKLSPEIFYSRTVKLCGIGESKAAAMIQDMIDAQTNPTIAPYAKTGEVHLRVTARAKDEQEGKKLVKPVIRELKKRFGEMVYTTKEERTLEEAVVKLLKKNKMSITCAESCT